jgi:ABC-2 type transport system permease protein
MTAIASTFTIMRYAFRAGLADYRSMYTWKSWLAGWLVRVLAQVSFFALIGERLGDDEQTTFYLLVGNALAVAAVTGVFSLNSTSGERWAGTLSLLVASPSSPVIVFGSRGSYLAVDGTLSALSALFIAGPLFGMDLPWPDILLVVPLTALVAYSCYCFGTFLAGIVFRFRNINGFVVLTSYMTIMAVCGVNVPLTYYPEVLEWISRFLPLTNGLLAIREVLAGSSAGTILGYAALEAAVAAGWMIAALLSFNQLASRGRHDGTLDFGA